MWARKAFKMVVRPLSALSLVVPMFGMVGVVAVCAVAAAVAMRKDAVALPIAGPAEGGPGMGALVEVTGLLPCM